MKTTAIFAEILAVGAQALVWMALAGYRFFGAEELKSWDWARIGDWAPALSVLVLMLTYTVGVIMDRIADTFVKPLRDWRKLIQKLVKLIKKHEETGSEEGKSFSEKRLEVRLKGGEMAVFLDYVRSRLRIARATVVNIALIAAFAYVAVEEESTRSLVFRVGVVAFGCAYYAWWRIRLVYEERLEQAYDLISDVTL